ncbi:MAG: class I SAM-dependent methyltransferase [Bacteroidota bacterium]
MNEKYDRIGQGYNDTRQADPYLLSRMQTLLHCPVGEQVLDIGCGTGNYTIALAESGLSMIGVEPSEQMLTTASRNAEIDWRKGHAESLPLSDQSVARVLASLTLHHWQDLKQGFAEVARVLKPSGRMLIFTATHEQMRGYWLNHYFPQMLADSIAQMPDWGDVVSAIETAGLKSLGTESYSVQDDLIDHFLYVGKNRPQLYLQAEIRRGISSFADLAYQDEVQKGLEQLRADITSGEWEAVRRQFTNAKGDYLFWLVEKPD